jgi:hypothetical protein
VLSYTRAQKPRNEIIVRTASLEFQVLNSIQVFYADLLRKLLGHAVPVPEQVNVQPAGNVSALDSLRQWINLLDLAITPVMVRDALKAAPDRGVACALLQHYAWKGSLADTDRDKTDFVVTYLFRKPPLSGDWSEQDGPSQEAEAPPGKFELALKEIVSSGENLTLAPEHRQLAREFFFLRQEVDDFRHFDELMDSGIMQRVRDIKESFGASFYHPHVLANIASYNAVFGQRVDTLFHDAIREIKEFAEKVLREGGSIMTRVHGDVTVKQLADLQESKILGTEYQRSIEYFYRLARYRKAVDLRKGNGESTQKLAQQIAAGRAPGTPPEPGGALSPSATAHSDGLEDNKLQAMEESIRNFIRAAGPKTTVPVVPLRHGSLGLLAAETEAFRVEYVFEKSFRADVARSLVRSVSLIGRMLTELADYRSKQQSAYLWKPHADSLAYLLRLSQESLEHGQKLVTLAQERGLVDKAKAIGASLERLQEQVKIVADALRSLGAAAQ